MNNKLPSDCGNYPDDWEDDNDEKEFIPCDRCDGHPACEDFGCAFELGLGKKVIKKSPFEDDWT